MLRTYVFALLAVLYFACQITATAADPPRVDRLSVHEVALQADGQYANPYTDLTADAELIAPSSAGQTRSVPLFWDGGSSWKFRVRARRSWRLEMDRQKPRRGAERQVRQLRGRRLEAAPAAFAR